MQRPIARLPPWIACALCAACSTSGTRAAKDAGPPPIDAGQSAESDASDESLLTSDAAPGTDGGWACTPAPTPPVGDPITGLVLFDGWTDPRALPSPVNTSGWEDSEEISADGTRLYFAYTQWDFYLLETQGRVVVDGPTRPGEIGPAFAIFEATIENGTWNVVASTVNSPDPNVAQAAEGVDDAQTTMALVRSTVGQPGILQVSHATNGTWGMPEPLPSPINGPCLQDNASLSGDGEQLFFDSNRADSSGTICGKSTSATGRTIYTSSFSNGVWGAPAPVGGTPNQGVWHSQGYGREGQHFYWTGVYDAQCTGDGCLYRADLQADGSYAGATLVATPIAPGAAAKVGDAYAIGEVSTTCDGKYLYFVYIQRTANGADLNVGVARKP